MSTAEQRKLAHVHRVIEQTIADALVAGSPCFVTGPSGSGKTVVCHAVLAALARRDHACFLFDASASTDVRHPVGPWASELAAELSMSLESGQPRSERVTSILQQQTAPVVLAFDEITGIASVAPILGLQRALYGRPDVPAIRFLFSGTLSMLAHGRLAIADSSIFWLPDLEADEISAVIDASPAVLERILWWTGGMPMATRHLWALLPVHASLEPAAVDAAASTLRDGYFQSGIIEWAERLLYSAPVDVTTAALALYEAVLRGDAVESTHDASEELLALAGLIRRNQGESRLRPRSALSRSLFDEAWIARTPLSHKRSRS